MTDEIDSSIFNGKPNEAGTDAPGKLLANYIRFK